MPDGTQMAPRASIVSRRALLMGLLSVLVSTKDIYNTRRSTACLHINTCSRYLQQVWDEWLPDWDQNGWPTKAGHEQEYVQDEDAQSVTSNGARSTNGKRAGSAVSAGRSRIVASSAVSITPSLLSTQSQTGRSSDLIFDDNTERLMDEDLLRKVSVYRRSFFTSENDKPGKLIINLIPQHLNPAERLCRECARGAALDLGTRLSSKQRPTMRSSSDAPSLRSPSVASSRRASLISPPALVMNVPARSNGKVRSDINALEEKSEVLRQGRVEEDLELVDAVTAVNSPSMVVRGQKDSSITTIEEGAGTKDHDSSLIPMRSVSRLSDYDDARSGYWTGDEDFADARSGYGQGDDDDDDDDISDAGDGDDNDAGNHIGGQVRVDQVVTAPQQPSVLPAVDPNLLSAEQQVEQPRGSFERAVHSALARMDPNKMIQKDVKALQVDKLGKGVEVNTSNGTPQLDFSQTSKRQGKPQAVAQSPPAQQHQRRSSSTLHTTAIETTLPRSTPSYSRFLSFGRRSSHVSPPGSVEQGTPMSRRALLQDLSSGRTSGNTPSSEERIDLPRLKKSQSPGEPNTPSVRFDQKDRIYSGKSRKPQSPAEPAMATKDPARKRFSFLRFGSNRNSIMA